MDKRGSLFILLVLATAAVQGRDIECLSQQSSGSDTIFLQFPRFKDENPGFPLPPNPTVWFKLQEGYSLKDKDVLYLMFGDLDSTGDVSTDFRLDLKIRGNFLQYSFKSNKGKQEQLTVGRLPTGWLNAQNWTSFTLGGSTFGFQFGKKDDQTLNIQLDGYEIGDVHAVKIAGNMNVTASVLCDAMEEEETTTATTSSVTVPPTTTTLAPLESTENLTTIDDLDNVTDAGNEAYTDVTYFEITDSNFTQGPDIVPVPVKAESDGQDCSIPVWVWVCIVIMAVFIVLLFLLFVYIISLKRRIQAFMGFGSASEKGYEGSPGGYGQQARDLQFFKPGMKEDSVMIIAPQPGNAAYTQTLQLPAGNQAASEVRFHTGPRESQYRRSTSCPGPRDLSPSISFPAPPSTPPPEARPETVPLFCPNGSVDNSHSRPRSHSKSRHSNRSSSRKKTKNREGIDADDENSLSN